MTTPPDVGVGEYLVGMAAGIIFTAFVGWGLAISYGHDQRKWGCNELHGKWPTRAEIEDNRLRCYYEERR